MTVERDFVTDLRLLVINPGIRDMGPDVTGEIRLDLLAKRHVLRITQSAIGLRLALGLALCADDDIALFVL